VHGTDAPAAASRRRRARRDRSAAAGLPGRRRRRPSGEAPPLPRTLNRSGQLWLGAAGAVLVLWAAIIMNQRTAQLVLVNDNRVVEWAAGLRT
jgi:hypothetical protein